MTDPQKVLARVVHIRGVMEKATKGEWQDGSTGMIAVVTLDGDRDRVVFVAQASQENRRAIALAHNIILHDLDAIEALARMDWPGVEGIKPIDDILSRWMAGTAAKVLKP